MYTPDLTGRVSLNVRLLTIVRFIGALLICALESVVTSTSVPLSTLSQEIVGMGTPSAVQENRAGSGETTLTSIGETVMDGATGVRSDYILTHNQMHIPVCEIIHVVRLRIGTTYTMECEYLYTTRTHYI